MRVLMPAAAFVLIAGPALAGTVITSAMSLPQAGNDKSVVYLDKDRVRVEAPGSITIYRGDQNTAYMINLAEKKFVKMTPETMKKMAAQMEAMRAQLQEQMKSMPPEQRAQMEKMMAGSMPGQPAKIEFRKAGGTASFGKWKCEKVDQLVNGAVQAQLCIAKLSDLGLGDADLGVLQRFAAFMQQAAPQSTGPGMMDPKALEKAIGYPGFAIHMEIPQAKVQSTTNSVEQKTLSADLFEVPQGYKEEALPGPGH